MNQIVVERCMLFFMSSSRAGMTRRREWMSREECHTLSFPLLFVLLPTSLVSISRFLDLSLSILPPPSHPFSIHCFSCTVRPFPSLSLLSLSIVRFTVRVSFLIQRKGRQSIYTRVLRSFSLLPLSRLPSYSQFMHNIMIAPIIIYDPCLFFSSRFPSFTDLISIDKYRQSK